MERMDARTRVSGLSACPFFVSHWRDWDIRFHETLRKAQITPADVQAELMNVLTLASLMSLGEASTVLPQVLVRSQSQRTQSFSIETRSKEDVSRTPVDFKRAGMLAQVSLVSREDMTGGQASDSNTGFPAFLSPPRIPS